MIQTFRQKLNGNLTEIIKLLVIGAVLVWTFCQVRDLPTVYATKQELATSLTELKTDNEKQMDRIFSKLNDIESYLRDKK
jgi:hypothetical protein